MESSNGSPAPASQARALALEKLKKKSRVLACKGGCLLRTLILYPRVKHSPAWPPYLCPLCQEPFKPVPLEAICPSKQ